MSRFYWKLRGRLARWAAGPFLEARYDHTHNAIEAGYKPESYHPDWWLGRETVLIQVARDMQAGKVDEAWSVNDWKAHMLDKAGRPTARPTSGRERTDT